jgi:hypothetical protein
LPQALSIKARSAAKHQRAVSDPDMEKILKTTRGYSRKKGTAYGTVNV